MSHYIIQAATIILLFLFLFLSLSPSTTNAANPAVLDADGRPLRAGYNYYILPVFRGRGGGLAMSSKNSTELCPLYVAQENNEMSKGLPLKFYPVSKGQRITVSTDLNFVFDASTICVQSNVWQLTIDEATGRRYIGVGGQIGNPGVGTVSNWFKIEKAGSGKYDYKIVFCPTVCNFCKVMCGDVGVFFEGRRMLLGFSDQQPLLVMFKKV